MEFNKHLGDIHKKSIPELKELLERQEKLLAKRSTIKNLKDKGEKIRRWRDELQKTLDERHAGMYVVTNMMKKISISPSKKEPVENEVVEEQNELHTLANNETNLSVEMEDKLFYAKLGQNIDGKESEKQNKLNKPKATNVKREVIKTKTKLDEESAVIYPVGSHFESKFLTFGESLHLQPEYLARVKEVKPSETHQLTETDVTAYHPDQIRNSVYKSEETECTLSHDLLEIDLDLD